MKRRDAHSRYVIVWLAVMLLAGLVGWLLREPACALPPMLSAVISDNQGGAAVNIFRRIGAALYALAAVMIVVAVIAQGLRHKIHMGARYALRHWLLWRNIRKALFPVRKLFFVFSDQALLLFGFFFQPPGFFLQAFLEPFIFLPDLIKLDAQLACGLRF